MMISKAPDSILITNNKYQKGIRLLDTPSFKLSTRSLLMPTNNIPKGT